MQRSCDIHKTQAPVVRGPVAIKLVIGKMGWCNGAVGGRGKAQIINIVSGAVSGVEAGGESLVIVQWSSAAVLLLEADATQWFKNVNAALLRNFIEGRAGTPGTRRGGTW